MTSDNASDQNDNAKVRIPPPLCFAAFLIAGLLLQSDWINGEIGSGGRNLFGTLLFAISLGVIIKEALAHKKSGSNVEPWKPTTLILSTGLYAYSRNPIYVGMTFAYLGVAFAAGSFGAMALLPFCLLIIYYRVIALEEAYLARKFGDEYLAYKQKVRRWL